MTENSLKDYKKRIFEIIQLGQKGDFISAAYDYILVATIICNLSILFIDTFSPPSGIQPVLDVIETFTLAFFIVEYALRLWTAEFIYPDCSPQKAKWRFAFSFEGIIDLLTILPYFLPVFFPSGIVAFRVLRVFRIFHLFRINAQYDSFNVVIDVLINKKNQLFSSICIILIMMLAASMSMYSLEHNAQPEMFKNAFSGLWWAVSAILTVGYGDIYPITIGGRIMAIFISFLGVGLVAIPTGIISAGFVEQYSHVETLSDFAAKSHEKYIMLHLDENSHPWIGKKIDELALPPELIVAAVIRDDKVIVPDKDALLTKGDLISLCRTEF